MLKKKLNSSINQHIINTDLLQKYVLTDINKIPKIKEIVFSTDLVNSSSPNNVSEEFNHNYSVFIFYSFAEILPSILLNNNNILTSTKKNFNLKIVLKNKNNIEMFLNNIFLDLMEKEEDIKKIKITQNESSFNIFLPIQKNLDSNSKTKLNINLSFKFNQITMKKKFLFRKYPYFWIF
jgi:hypothetical protein